MNRRHFLKTALVSGTVAGLVSNNSQAGIEREAKALPPKAVGMLYDSTLCIGCKACVAACKAANNQPVEIADHHAEWNRGQWDSAQDISGKTLNVIKAYFDETSSEKNLVKDQEKNGYAFMKRHCLHCVDPSCVSVCPVSAMQKNADTGIVTYNPDACIGCRYCVVSCPFSVPQFEYDTPFPKIHKCQFCTHLQAENKIPACCDVCPTGASLFGDARALREEAKRRLTAQAGSEYEFPRGKIGFTAGQFGAERPGHIANIPNYQQHVYGVQELGGTQVVYLSGIPFDTLGLPTNVPDQSYASVSEGIQHTLYKNMVAPLVLLAGLTFFAYRNRKHVGEDEED